MKSKAINFVTYLEDNGWQCIYSEQLKKRAYVDSSKHSILVHGSDVHFTRLVQDHGKQLEELYDIFDK